MTEYLSIKTEERIKITDKIKQILSKKRGLVFAYLFGSFIDAPSFRDIDIGLFFKKVKRGDVSRLELKLSQDIAKACNLPFDIIEIHILNFAPSSFLSNIFRNGNVIMTKDAEALSGMIENASLDAIANEDTCKQSIKELIST
jgi:uncharacterized protein